MELNNFAYRQRLSAGQQTLLGTLSLNFGALLRAAVPAPTPSRRRIGEPWPEPSRIEWEDTQ